MNAERHAVQMELAVKSYQIKGNVHFLPPLMCKSKDENTNKYITFANGEIAFGLSH